MIGSIRILIPEELLTPSGDEMFEYSRFADELRRYFSGRVEVRPDRAENVDEEAILLLFRSEPSRWMVEHPSHSSTRILSRTLLMLAPRAPGLLNVLEHHGLAGGVETARYLHWVSSPHLDTGYGVAGLRRVVTQICGECAERPFATDHYCIFQSAKSTGLPQAVAEYCSQLGEAWTLE